MYSTLLTVALLFAPALQGVFAEFAINTPDLVECEDAKISWQPTKGPYNLIVVPASDPCSEALVEIGDFNQTSITWKTSVPAGTKVVLSLEDGDGDEAWSGEIEVGKGSGTCSSSSSAVPSGSAAPSQASAAPSTGGTTLVIPPAASSAAADSTASVAPVGAANAGTNPFSNGALNTRQISTPVMALSALAVAIALAL
ncbi:hypothetical protein BDQ12DRAFT_446196 [Crucibulum laeve]|uniref:Ser-Thr-rich glycosyl-phosphatidyl-inositol-anchored membrane family-domain-containing protein n=1 Tax=Crucibulum laeve TaxID=68775 RepID=A0A5C3LKG7_9AGAR|nr:hypothetical protein BDQ12DRAFT_446196 [Crucibulum laeve]